MMGILTRQEKYILLFLATVLFFGSGLSLTLKLYPELSDYINLIDGESLYAKTDINTASHEQLVSIAYIGDYTAGAIIRRRAEKKFESVEEVLKIKGVHRKNYEKFSPYLTVNGGGR